MYCVCAQAAIHVHHLLMFLASLLRPQSISLTPLESEPGFTFLISSPTGDLRCVCPEPSVSLRWRLSRWEGGHVCAQVQALCASVCGLSMCPCDRKSDPIEHCMSKGCVERGVDLEADIPGLKS